MPGNAARGAVAGAVLGAVLAGCAAVGATAPAPAVEFVVVRHAEKVDASRDPDLSEQGRARAQALAERLRGRGLVAAYATEFKRTGQTIAPAASAHGIAPSAYPASLPAATLAAKLQASHRRGVVLIAGHSNTVPAIVAALCACETSPMADHEYDRLSIVQLDAHGRARLIVERYGSASPTR